MLACSGQPQQRKLSVRSALMLLIDVLLLWACGACHLHEFDVDLMITVTTCHNHGDEKRGRGRGREEETTLSVMP